MHLFISLLLEGSQLIPKCTGLKKKKKKQHSRDAGVRWIININYNVQSVLNSKCNLEFAES